MKTDLFIVLKPQGLTSVCPGLQNNEEFRILFVKKSYQKLRSGGRLSASSDMLFILEGRIIELVARSKL